MAGRLFCFTIRPGRLSLASVAYEFTSIPGRVQFPFYFSLVAVTRIRASVSTPPEESILANKHTLYTHLGAPLPAYPYKTRVGGSRSYEVPTTRSTLPKTKGCVCQVRFFVSWVGRVRPEMLCLRTRLPLFPKASRGRLYDDGRPPVGGFTAQGPCRGKALSQRIEDAQLRTT